MEQIYRGLTLLGVVLSYARFNLEFWNARRSYWLLY